jgi:uncharacterized OB-fold protein
MSTAEKPIPVASDADQPYWDGAKQHKLVLPRCARCGLFSARLRVICPRCRGEVFDWTEVSGRGRIHSYTVVYQSTIAGFRDDTPYVVCHAYIDEEPTCYITTNLAGVSGEGYDSLNIETPVVMSYEDRGDAVVPQWRLAQTAPGVR